MSQATEDIKSRLDIVEFISQYLPLKKSGVSFKACCPFHNEKTPSFYVSRDKGMWYCFGCNEGGDIFTFAQKMEGMDFGESLKLLADKAGVRLPEYKPEHEELRTRILAIALISARYFRHCLTSLPEGEFARQYVTARKISRESEELFGLGYAPAGWENLCNFLRSKKYSDAEMVQAGLAIPRERGSGAYDRFRRRLMFPIRDTHGRVVAFTGRLLPPEDKNPDAGGKYVNSPETLLYKKSAIIYGLDLAWREIKKQDRAVLVEGNTDVIACHQAGMTNVVASSGTALTPIQVALLARYTTNLTLAFDADKAGNAAAMRGIEIATEAGMHLSVVQIPPGAGKDASEVLEKDPQIWSGAVHDAVPFIAFAITNAVGGRDLSLAEEKSKVANLVLPLIAKIPDPVETAHWIKELDRVLRVGEDALRQKIKSLGSTESRETTSESNKSDDPPTSVGEHLLAILITAPRLIPEAMGKILPDHLPPHLAPLYTELVMAYNTGGVEAVTHVGETLQKQGNTHIFPSFSRTLMIGERDISPLGDKDQDAELRVTMGRIMAQFRTRRRDEIAALMQKAEAAGDRGRVAELTREFHELV